MQLKKIYGFLVLSVGACALQAAENNYKPGEYYFSPGVAYYHFSEKRDVQNAALVNISAGYVASEQWSVEAFYGQASTEAKPVSSDKNERFYAYWVDGVYHFQPDDSTSFHPYALAGLGLTNQDEQSYSSGNTTLLSVNAGAGIDYFVSSNISVFAEARDIYTLSGGQNDWMLNAGIRFLFEDDPATSTEKSSPAIETSGTTGFYELQDSSREEG